MQIRLTRYRTTQGKLCHRIRCHSLLAGTPTLRRIQSYRIERPVAWGGGKEHWISGFDTDHCIAPVPDWAFKKATPPEEDLLIEKADETCDVMTGDLAPLVSFVLVFSMLLHKFSRRSKFVQINLIVSRLHVLELSRVISKVLA